MRRHSSLAFPLSSLTKTTTSTAVGSSLLRFFVEQQFTKPNTRSGSQNSDDDHSNINSQQQNEYVNANQKPKEGRGVMGKKVNKLVEEENFFADPRDGDGIRDGGGMSSSSSSRQKSTLAPADEIVKDEYASASPVPDSLDSSKTTPGDTFGTYETRQPFLRPLKRNTSDCDNFEFRHLMPETARPESCVAPDLLRLLSAKYAMTPKEVLHLMIDSNHDINRFLYTCERKLGKNVQPGDYGLVALEAYDPETFCLVNYTLPSFEFTRNEEVLEALHELTLSAAEIPLDTPRDQVKNRFMNDWTTDSDESCREILKMIGAGVRDIVLLPYGEYSSQGFYISHSDPNFTNMGTGAAAVCFDLRSGVHKRFRFHAERNADSLAEHLVREQMHFDQWYVHFLRQAFWFNPDYSVEDFIRYKESLMMPSATVFEVRTAVMLHNLGGRPAYRNIAEIEKVKIAQHKLEKGGKEQQMAGNLFDHNGGSKVINSMQAPQSSQYLSNQSGKKGESNNYKEITLENKVFGAAEISVHAERIWRKFYRNNFY